jgi:hypothetical protein
MIVQEIQMKKTIPVASAVMLILGMLLYAMPACAGKLQHLDASCSRGVKLSRASGVPDSAVHSYVFEGSCSLLSVLTTGPYVNARPPLSATARWDNRTHIYTEHLHFLTKAKIKMNAGDGWTGMVQVTTDPEEATFTCSADPIIHKDAYCSLVKQHNGTGWGKQYDGFAWRPAHNQPLLLGAATLSRARALSKRNSVSSISCTGPHLTDTTGATNGCRRSIAFAAPATCTTAKMTAVDSNHACSR